MSTIQKIAMALLPKSWVDKMRAESETWLLRCETCGTTRSVWECGGIRAGASSKGKRSMIHCPGCNRLTWHAMEQSIASSSASAAPDAS